MGLTTLLDRMSSLCVLMYAMNDDDGADDDGDDDGDDDDDVTKDEASPKNVCKKVKEKARDALGKTQAGAVSARG